MTNCWVLPLQAITSTQKKYRKKNKTYILKLLNNFTPKKKFLSKSDIFSMTKGANDMDKIAVTVSLLGIVFLTLSVSLSAWFVIPLMVNVVAGAIYVRGSDNKTNA